MGWVSSSGERSAPSRSSRVQTRARLESSSAQSGRVESYRVRDDEMEMIRGCESAARIVGVARGSAVVEWRTRHEGEEVTEERARARERAGGEGPKRQRAALVCLLARKGSYVHPGAPSCGRCSRRFQGAAGACTSERKGAGAGIDVCTSMCFSSLNRHKSTFDLRLCQ